MNDAVQTTYTIRVDGHLDDHRAASLGEVAITREDDGMTTVTVSVADQAKLHGVLARLRDIGAVLIELRAAAAPGRADAPVPRRTLHTARLALRPATVDDAEPTGRYRRFGTVGEWLNERRGRARRYRDDVRRSRPSRDHRDRHPRPRRGVPPNRRLQRAVEDAWAQREVADRARDAQAELGWVLDPAHTGNGYATEAVRELLRHCFEGPRRAPRHRWLLPRQRRLLASHGTRRHAPRAARDPRRRCTARAAGWTRSATPCWRTSGRRPEPGLQACAGRRGRPREERRMKSEEPAPETTGVTQELLATVDLGPEIQGMAGRMLRLRMVTIEPGGVYGPVHDHVDRPGIVYVLQGTITDHRDGVATDYGPGVGWPEDRSTVHWLENRGTTRAVEISVDIVRSERLRPEMRRSPRCVMRRRTSIHRPT